MSRDSHIWFLGNAGCPLCLPSVLQGLGFILADRKLLHLHSTDYSLTLQRHCSCVFSSHHHPTPSPSESHVLSLLLLSKRLLLKPSILIPTSARVLFLTPLLLPVCSAVLLLRLSVLWFFPDHSGPLSSPDVSTARVAVFLPVVLHSH